MDRVGGIQRWDAPTLQRSQDVAGAGVSDTPIEHDVEIESASSRIGSREIQDQFAVEHGSYRDATTSCRGENRLFFRSYVRDKHAESRRLMQRLRDASVGSRHV